MSLCDKCYAPGRCCTRIQITNVLGEPAGYESLYGLKHVTQQIREEMPTSKFVAIKKIPGTDGFFEDIPVAQYIFDCEALQPNGRCGIYETRPNVCRKYEAASDSLCVHYQGAEGGEGVEFPE